MDNALFLPFLTSGLLLAGWLMVLICLAESNFFVGFNPSHSVTCSDLRNSLDLANPISPLYADLKSSVNACDVSVAWLVFAVIALVTSFLLMLFVLFSAFEGRLPVPMVHKLVPSGNLLLSIFTLISALLTLILSIVAYAQFPDKSFAMDDGYEAIPAVTAVGSVLMMIASGLELRWRRNSGAVPPPRRSAGLG